ncbi:MAG: haloacid dehalogenase type II [Pseudomonadota bacterium]
MVKAAIFDVFGTVVDWRTGVAAVMADAFFKKGIEHDASAFADAWRAEYDPAMARIREGGRGYVPLDDLHLENLARVLDARHLDGAFDAMERAALNKAWEMLPPWPDSVAGLAAIKAAMPIAPCSNGSIALMTSLARHGGLPWDCILGAEIARDYKPKAEVYLAACAALRLPPEDVVMVAAHNNDLVAARAAGLKTAFIPRPDEKGPRLGETRAEEDWDWIADDILALASALVGEET